MGLQDIYSKLSDQEKKILYVTLGFIVLAAFDFLFLQPVSSKLKNLDKEIQQTKSDIKRDVRYMSYQDRIYKEDEIYRFYQTDEDKTEDEITAVFLKTIENLGRESEVNLGKLNPGEAIPKKGYVQYFANVECNGKLESIVKFIHKINTTPNLLKVVKMNIVGKKSSADEVTVAMKISKLIVKADSSDSGKIADKSLSAKEVSGAVTAGNVGTLTSQGKKSEGAKTQLGSSGGGRSSSGPRGSLDESDSGGGGGSELGVRTGHDNSGGGSGGSGLGGGGKTGSSGGGGGGGGASEDDGGGNQAVGADGGQVGGGAGGRGEQSDSGGEVGAGGAGGGVSSTGGGGGSGSGASGAAVNGAAGRGGGSGGVGAGGSGGAGVGGGSGGGGGEEAGDEGDVGPQAEIEWEGGRPSAAGAAGGQSKSSAQKTKTDRSSKEQNTNKPESKKPIAVEKITTGERLKVSNLETLWNDFWKIKPKEKKAVVPEKRILNSKEYKTEEEVKPNLFEKLLK
ncbi:MAG: type 4a pilus biogenesis protein PilO [Candidatus Omnitrophica bacterium]|nr:type 4a pilus biogenesis protein PilO [Candidatus Omnitrophota bacterium]